MTELAPKKLTRSYFVVFALALVLYTITCALGSLWQDSGMFQYRIWHNDIKGGLGLALAHPLYHLIAIATKCVPFGEFGYRVNLISAVCGALTVANIFLLIRLAVGGIVPAIVGAVSLALSWTFWQHCVIAEVYTMYTAIFPAELIFLFLFFKNWYARQIVDVRNDVKVISGHGDYKNPIDFVTVQTLDKLLAEGAVYVVSAREGYCPKFILDNKKYRFVESGPIHRKRGWL